MFRYYTIVFLFWCSNVIICGTESPSFTGWDRERQVLDKNTDPMSPDKIKQHKLKKVQDSYETKAGYKKKSDEISEETKVFVKAIYNDVSQSRSQENVVATKTKPAKEYKISFAPKTSKEYDESKETKVIEEDKNNTIDFDVSDEKYDGENSVSLEDEQDKLNSLLDNELELITTKNFTDDIKKDSNDKNHSSLSDEKFEFIKDLLNQDTEIEDHKKDTKIIKHDTKKQIIKRKKKKHHNNTHKVEKGTHKKSGVKNLQSTNNEMLNEEVGVKMSKKNTKKPKERVRKKLKKKKVKKKSHTTKSKRKRRLAKKKKSSKKHVKKDLVLEKIKLIESNTTKKPTEISTITSDQKVLDIIQKIQNNLTPLIKALLLNEKRESEKNITVTPTNETITENVLHQKKAQINDVQNNESVRNLSISRDTGVHNKTAMLDIENETDSIKYKEKIAAALVPEHESNTNNQIYIPLDDNTLHILRNEDDVHSNDIEENADNMSHVEEGKNVEKDDEKTIGVVLPSITQREDDDVTTTTGYSATSKHPGKFHKFIRKIRNGLREKLNKILGGP